MGVAPHEVCCRLLLLSSILFAVTADGYSPLAHDAGAGPFYPPAEAAKLIAKGSCEERWFDQELDHFSSNSAAGGEQLWKQRYYFCPGFWKEPKGPEDVGVGPIFFYTGNEGSVDGYVKATGLMWENAAPFSALLLFAEHRYYGKSLPFGENSFAVENLRYLTHEQALADYANLILGLKTTLGAQYAPTIAFGGSYGGMLSSWFRLKYPHVVDGAIAASAPILAFPGLDVPWQPERYWQVVTRDTFEENGGVPGCADAYKRCARARGSRTSFHCARAAARLTPPLCVRSGFEELLSRGASAEGRAELSAAFGTCDPLAAAGDARRLALHVAVAADTLAMGDFPCPPAPPASLGGAPRTRLGRSAGGGRALTDTRRTTSREARGSSRRGRCARRARRCSGRGAARARGAAARGGSRWRACGGRRWCSTTQAGRCRASRCRTTATTTACGTTSGAPRFRAARAAAPCGDARGSPGGRCC
jgi:pimeloyl-ACP methyl ester carboxylesterase